MQRHQWWRCQLYDRLFAGQLTQCSPCSPAPTYKLHASHKLPTEGFFKNKMVSGEKTYLFMENIHRNVLTFWGRSSSAWIGVLYLSSNICFGLNWDLFVKAKLFDLPLYTGNTSSTMQLRARKPGRKIHLMSERTAAVCHLTSVLYQCWSAFKILMIYWGFSLKGSTNENSPMSGQRRRVRTSQVL